MAVPQRFLRRREVESLVGLKHSRLYELIRLGRFPAPVRVSKGAVRWPEKAILEWQERLINELAAANREGRLTGPAEGWTDAIGPATDERRPVR